MRGRHKLIWLTISGNRKVKRVQRGYYALTITFKNRKEKETKKGWKCVGRKKKIQCGLCSRTEESELRKSHRLSHFRGLIRAYVKWKSLGLAGAAGARWRITYMLRQRRRNNYDGRRNRESSFTLLILSFLSSAIIYVYMCINICINRGNYFTDFSKNFHSKTL